MMNIVTATLILIVEPPVDHLQVAVVVAVGVHKHKWVSTRLPFEQIRGLSAWSSVCSCHSQWQIRPYRGKHTQTVTNQSYAVCPRCPRCWHQTSDIVVFTWFSAFWCEANKCVARFLPWTRNDLLSWNVPDRRDVSAAGGASDDSGTCRSAETSGYLRTGDVRRRRRIVCHRRAERDRIPPSWRLRTVRHEVSDKWQLSGVQLQRRERTMPQVPYAAELLRESTWMQRQQSERYILVYTLMSSDTSHLFWCHLFWVPTEICIQNQFTLDTSIMNMKLPQVSCIR